MMKRLVVIGVAAATACLTATARAWACAVCFAGTGDASTHGFNASVLFLMSTPYLVLGAIAGAVFFKYRRSLKRRESGDRAEEAEPPVIQVSWNQEESGR